jgi:hypothetical protein
MMPRHDVGIKAEPYHQKKPPLCHLADIDGREAASGDRLGQAARVGQ